MAGKADNQCTAKYSHTNKEDMSNSIWGISTENQRFIASILAPENKEKYSIQSF